MQSGQYRYYRRANGIYYREDVQTRAQASLGTRDKHVAQEKVRAANESLAQPTLNVARARIYLQAHDAESTRRTWEMVMTAYCRGQTSKSVVRCERAFKGRDFDPIRAVKIIDTKAEHLLQVLASRKRSVDNYLRRLVHHAENLGWLHWMIMAPAAWPEPKDESPKRPVLIEEHQRIIAAESNPERRAYYEMMWHTGGSQGDIALLERQNIHDGILRYRRRKLKKSAPMCCMRIGPAMAALLDTLPNEGWLFPGIAAREMKEDGDANQRAAEFSRRCRLLQIEGISLHSYRYSWIGRAAQCGYPQRHALAAVGHSKMPMHNEYLAGTTVVSESLETYERAHEKGNVIPFPSEPMATEANAKKGGSRR